MNNQLGEQVCSAVMRKACIRVCAFMCKIFIQLAFIAWWTQGTWVASLAALSMPRTANVTVCHLLGLGCLHSDCSPQPRSRHYAEVQWKALIACTAKWASVLWCLSGEHSSCSSDKYMKANVNMPHIILWVWACTLHSILTKCECLHCAASSLSVSAYIVQQCVGKVVL